MNVTTKERYHARFRKVFDYIEQHLDDNLSVEQLSGIAAFSKYHFHRQFTELFGISLYKYIQLIRLKRASYQLAFRDDKIIDIAFSSGYEGPEAFSRAFKNTIGQSPSEFRKQPQWNNWHTIYQPINELRNYQMKLQSKVNQVKIISFKAN